MIQDIAPHQYNVAYENATVKETDIILVFGADGLLCQMEGSQIAYPAAKDLAERVPEVYENATFLFHIDDTAYFMLEENGLLEFGTWNYLPWKQLRDVRPLWKAFAGVTGYQLYQWYAQNKFCGRCGAKLNPHSGERALQCPDCGRILYPQICPSVIVGITRGDQILLTKYASGHSSYRKYALVAGYSEVGESLEDTVRREVMEEVGLRVKNIRYYKSQPWSFSGALLAGFFCEVDSWAEITMDKEELSAAEWFDRDKLPVERSEASVSLTGEMIEAFRDGYA